EGGIRVPAMLRWPGVMPPGRVSGQVGITMDLTATILAVTEVEGPGDLDLEGIDLMPILTRQAPEQQRTLFWRSADGGSRAVRSGDWKLLVDGRNPFVFDVRADVAEREDLTNVSQEVAYRLRMLLDAWEADVNGLARASRRGYYFTYGLVLYATMFHGLPLVPVVTSLLPTQMLRSGSVFVLNLGFLSAAIASHRLLESSDRNPMAAPPRRTRT